MRLPSPAVGGQARRALCTAGVPCWFGRAHRRKSRRSSIPCPLDRLLKQPVALNGTGSSMWVLPEKFEEGLVDEKGETLSKRWVPDRAAREQARMRRGDGD